MTRFSSLEKFFLALVMVGGSLILFFPVQNLLFGLLGLIVFVLLLANPKYCFYLMLVLSTYVPAFATASREMPFNQTDILITLCFISVLCKIMMKNHNLNLSTKLDKWLIVLSVVYFFAGFTSIAHNGYQGFLKFGETAAVFYLTIYFLRTKEIRLSELLKVIIFIGVFQSLYGILQSVTGSFGANFQDNRGYLGYLGLGSSLVWHGRGTFAHFNSLGPFLCTLFLFFLPINHFIAKNKKKGKIILMILFFGVITTYSRGSLMALIAGSMFFMFQIQKNKGKFLLKLAPLVLVISGISELLKNSSYISTISPRNEQWDLAFNAIMSSTKNLLFGSGLRSYSDAVWPYLPGNIPQSSYNDYYAHNFFLAYAVEVGILGLVVIVSFLLSILISAYKGFKNGTKLGKSLNLSISMIIFSILFEGMFDHAFNMFVFQIWLYLFFGILYYKNSCDNKEKN